METLIVGCGMTGLRTASLLQVAGHDVTVVDKGRRHGGRMATRRVDDAVFDTGVVEFSASTPAFREHLGTAAGEGHAHSIDRATAGPHAASHWRGAPLMRSLPAAMASRAQDDRGAPGTVTVQLATTVTALSVRDGRWVVTLERDGAVELRTVDALVLTPPAPQSAALLRTTAGIASDATLARLDAVAYEPSLTVLVRPIDRTLGAAPIEDARGLTREDAAHDLVRLQDNVRSGASPVAALTLQASARYSDEHLDGDRDAAAVALAAQASRLTGTALEVVHVHGWRFAQVTTGIDLPALRDDTSGAPLVIAGDAFVTHAAAPQGVRLEGVERAFLSGGAAAALLIGAGPTTA